MGPSETLSASVVLIEPQESVWCLRSEFSPVAGRDLGLKCLEESDGGLGGRGGEVHGEGGRRLGTYKARPCFP